MALRGITRTIFVWKFAHTVTGATHWRKCDYVTSRHGGFQCLLENVSTEVKLRYVGRPIRWGALRRNLA